MPLLLLGQGSARTGAWSLKQGGAHRAKCSDGSAAQTGTLAPGAETALQVRPSDRKPK